MMMMMMIITNYYPALYTVTLRCSVIGCHSHANITQRGTKNYKYM